MRREEREFRDRLEALERGRALSSSVDRALTGLSGTIEARTLFLSGALAARISAISGGGGDTSALSGTIDAKFVSVSGTVNARFVSLSGSVDSRITTVSASLLTSPTFTGAVTASLLHITSLGGAATPALKIGSNGVGVYDGGGGLGVLTRGGGAFVSWDASATTFFNNLAKLSAGVATTGIQSPAQITSNQTDFDPFGGLLYLTRELRVSADAPRTINSLLAGQQGQRLRVWNTGSQPISLPHDDGATGTAANRFLCPGSASVTLSPQGSTDMWYDTVPSRWRLCPSADASLMNALSGTVNASIASLSGTINSAFVALSASVSASSNQNRISQAFLPWYFQTANSISTLTPTNTGIAHAFYMGKAPTRITGSVTVRTGVNSIGGPYTWMEMAIATGSYVLGGPTSLQTLGYASMLNSWNTASVRTDAVPISGAIEVGQDYWIVIGVLATNSPALRATSFGDPLQAGFTLTGSTPSRPSTFTATPGTFSVGGTGVATLWAVVVLP